MDNIGKIQQRNIEEELRESYLDYAMSVIISRALPDARDGFKPVHRRILYTMLAELGLRHTSKYVKSARVVGDVLGKYHPHGDVAVYDTMVRLAQDFSLRYPLIQGQGNFGSIDGDSAAAMRYTEARLTAIAEEMLADIEKETVDFMPNYDASREEPKVLPTKIPQLLLNGTMGIAVGMATNIPPHNLVEVSDALMHLIDHPKATNEDLAEFVKGPDFPTGGIIYGKKTIKEAYATGKGSILVRGKAEVTENKKGGMQITITEMPYQVNKSEFIQKIAQLHQDKKLEGIKDIRDESDRAGMHIVIELKSNAFPEKILNRLYSYTDLEKSFHLNMLALVGGGMQPQILSLKQMLEEFLQHRFEVVTRRSRYDLRKAQERAHILEGLKKALDHIDAIIAVIKKSANREEAHDNLMSKFKLSDPQANAILEMKLQSLAGLERKKIEEELKEKREFIKYLKELLSDNKKIYGVVRAETAEIKEKYGDLRRTKVVASEPGEFSEEDLIAQEEIFVALSYDGFIKRMSPTSFKAQRRGGKGIIGFETKDGEDLVEYLVAAKTHDQVLFFTSSGRVFRAAAYEIPEATRQSRGKAVQNFLGISTEEKITALLSYDAKNKEKAKKYLVMVTRQGVIKKTAVEEFENVRRSGLAAIKLKKGDSLEWVNFSSGSDEIVIATKGGMAIRFSEKDVRSMGRTASGVTGMRLKGTDQIIGMGIVSEKANPNILVVSEKGFGKKTPIKSYRLQRRGGTGIKTLKVTPKTGPLASLIIANEEKELVAISAKGQMIRIELSSIPSLSRGTQGVRIMRMNGDDTVAAVSLL